MYRRILPLLASTAFCFAQAPTVDDIVAKHIAASGGVDKIRAIKTTKSTGKVTLGGGQMEATQTTWSHRPSKQRREIEFQGGKIISAFDGSTVWVINPMSGSLNPQKLPDDEAKAAAANADPDGSPLIDYKAKGHGVELQGKEEVNGRMAYKLKVAVKGGQPTTIFLDEQTYLPSKVAGRAKQMGQEMDIENYMSNYKAVDGVMMPMSTETRVNGNVMMEATVEKIETNVPIDDAMFAFPTPPAPSAKPAAPVK